MGRIGRPPYTEFGSGTSSRYRSVGQEADGPHRRQDPEPQNTKNEFARGGYNGPGLEPRPRIEGPGFSRSTGATRRDMTKPSTTRRAKLLKKAGIDYKEPRRRRLRQRSRPIYRNPHRHVLRRRLGLGARNSGARFIAARRSGIKEPPHPALSLQGRGKKLENSLALKGRGLG